MIHKLRQRFILVTAISLILVMSFVAAAINLVAANRFTYEADQKLSVLSQNNGDTPASLSIPSKDTTGFPWEFSMTQETPYEMRYFYVFIDTTGNIVTNNIDNIVSVQTSEAGTLALQAFDSGKRSGYKSQYRYQVSEKPNGHLVIFLDCSYTMQLQQMLLFISISVGLISMLLVLLLVSLFSTRALQPLILNEKKQRQFIADASHELKTPLSIILANTDLVEIQSGKSEWTASIRNQIARMDNLIHQLLNQAKSEEQALNDWVPVNFSRLTEELFMEFKPVAEAHGKEISADIEANLQLKGDLQRFHQLVSILLDNAISHSTDHAHIKISLSCRLKTLQLIVSNESYPIKNSELSKLFDRFYRLDRSRTRTTGGLGMGLSIANSIVQPYHGRISADYSQGRMRFEVDLPRFIGREKRTINNSKNIKNNRNIFL